MIEVSRLWHVVLVAQEGSFARAAQAANLSQPALSRSIQSVERQFGVKLFDRSRSGVLLTGAGRNFLALAEAFVRRAESLEAEFGVIGTGSTSAVPFGVGPLGAALLLDQLADLIFEKDIRASVRVDNDSSLRKQLLDGEIEFFIGGSLPGVSDFAVSSRLRKEFIGTSRFGLLVRHAHPLRGLEAIASDQLAAYPLIGGSIMRTILDDTVLERTGLRYPSLELDNYGLLVDIATRTDAILLASPFLGVNSLGRGLAPLPLALPPERVNLPAVLVMLQDRSMSPAAELLAHRLVTLLRTVMSGYENAPR